MQADGIPVYDRVSDLAADYDAFILDLWGVLHDGLKAFHGAARCLERLQEEGKQVALLSNAPRMSSGLVTMMEELGLPRSSYNAIVSSGDAVHAALRDRTHPAYAALGEKVFFIGPDRALDVLDDLPYTRVETPGEADFILCSGPWTLSHSIDKYEPLIDECAETLPPMICSNPDRAVIRDGKVVVCAGNIADLYIARGGSVHETGKPETAVYDLALSKLGVTDRSSVAGVGDSFATDMRGCRGAGIAGILCARGIHATGLGVVPGEKPTSEAVSKLAQEYDVHPTAAIPAFVW